MSIFTSAQVLLIKYLFVDTPYGQVPVLYVDGEPIGQSKAIARYVAKIVKLAGKNDLEDLKIDSVVDFISDFEDSM